MTSETETLKTNEFLRRRKLRLQQVREQSKDIAKKIRQRAKVETLRQVVDLDAKKQKEYFDRQEKLVKRLEVLYSRGLNNVGASHQSASEVTLQDEVTKTDLSKLRGKEAAAELRKKRQEVLDQQKKLLDRKLQAREAANEISREKSSTVANKPLTKQSKVTENINQKVPSTTELVKDSQLNVANDKNKPEAVTKNDMATQWDIDTMPNEWEPAVPALSLPKDDQGSLKEDEQVESKSEKSRRLDLFALSKEMPTDLRGRHVDTTETRDTVRPSLTLVSEYLQSRKLRLREAEPVPKKRSEDISSLKQTILRTRTNRAEGSPYNACQVLDEQVVPVPSWRPEVTCEFCTPTITRRSQIRAKQFQSVTNSQINRIFSSIRPVRKPDMTPSPVLRSTSPFRRNKVCQRFMPGKSSTCTENSKPDSGINRKNSVVMYNHCTRDTRDLPCSDEPLVVRDGQSSEDAYSLAMKEVTAVHDKDKEHQKKVQDMRNKVAVTKQTVEKEYKDTINFLNSLPKNKSDKVPKVAYMDERRQQMQKDHRQHRMQQEYRKMEKECRRHHSCTNKSRSKSRSPTKQNVEHEVDRDFQYSWMPVPEGDGNLAVHTIPNTVKEGKTGNSVKFSSVDSYHEYRSRHKHTPPTKDTGSDKHSAKKRVETVIIDKNDTHSSDESTVSNTSSVENLRLENQSKKDNTKLDQNSSDAERIIIYKILDSKNSKYSKKKNKLLSDIAKSLTSIEKVQKSVAEDGPSDTDKRQGSKKVKPIIKTATAAASFEHINEGIYKVTEEGDNLTSMYYNDQMETNEMVTVTEQVQHQTCCCKKSSNDQRRDRGTVPQWRDGDEDQPIKTGHSCQCSTTSKDKDTTRLTDTQNIPSVSGKQPSACTSTSSFKTATTDKANTTVADGGFIKLLDEAGQEAGKFFLGSTGFLKDNAYEVVIQLRKKDGSKEDSKSKTDISDSTKLCHSGNKSSDRIQTSNSDSGMVNGESGSNTTVQATNKEVNEVLSDKNGSEKVSRKVSPRQSTPTTTKSIVKDAVVDHGVKDQNVPSTASIDEDIRLVISSEEKKNTSNKSTALKDDAPATMSKYDIPSRPATTTYTQTTNSPIHRPIYFHMSSSTSTAYMSPPEMILPKFFRPDSGLTEDETYGLRNIEIVNKQANKNNKKCRHAKKASSDGNTKVAVCKKNKHSTPPNSVRHYGNSGSPDSPSSLREQEPSTCRNTKTKCKCHNCGACIPLKNHVRKQCYANQATPVDTYRSTQSANIHLNRNVMAKNKCKSSNGGVSTKSSGANLNPIIRNYINKLLALNKEGLKALEVADQECSSVCTPGSSIINVPCNVDERKSSASNKISLEQIKKTLLQQIVKENFNNINNAQNPVMHPIHKIDIPRKPRRKPLHKVKSLNISKHLLKKHKTEPPKPKSVSLSTTTDENNRTFASSVTSRSRPRSSPVPRQQHIARPVPVYKDYTPQNTARREVKKTETCHNGNYARAAISSPRKQPPTKNKQPIHYPSHKATTTDTSQESKDSDNYYRNKADIPISMSTQTSQNMDNDFVKLAEGKLQNMEKIADLTEKCTKRLSNLAKVLEEVRKNKSLIYSQISASDSTDSQSDHRSENVIKTPDTIPCETSEFLKNLEEKQGEIVSEKENSVSDKEKSQLEYVSILADIPKTGALQISEPTATDPLPLNIPGSVIRSASTSPVDTNSSANEFMKCRPKPPPALSRIHLKHAQEYLPPHELSTVMEVDSPMSVKNKNQSARNEIANNSNRSSNEDKEVVKDDDKKENQKDKEPTTNPDLLQRNLQFPKMKVSSTESSDDSKFQMIDLKQFNEIMLEPFISINEYAKKYNVAAPDDGSNIEDIQRDDVVNDDMSSLHSDGSLPDVIAELLKRNIITEPFKFDTPSNVNSNTFSSESTLSMLALSKVRKARKRSSVAFQNKENIGETSDTLSISSNPDLENAFKRLGMGWASSTLKKTKERLALSSSSNTSSSSISQFKIKSFHQDIPALVTDSVSSVLLSKKGHHGKTFDDSSKHVEQQTSFVNSMTVKEFLTNELANKITFANNRSGMNETEEEFVSLFETKMPDGLKQQTLGNRDEQSNDSMPSGVNRARTSTPVQIFKSMTYHSSSSSNVSNGLFSNADDISSVKMTSNSMKNHSTSDKDDLTIPNFSLKKKKGSDCSKSD